MIRTAIQTIRSNPTAGALAGLVLLILLSCVTSGQPTQEDASNRIMAEHSQMKKRLPLVERENDVLKQENLQYRAKTQQLEANLEKLNSDLMALNEQYTRDMALNEEQIKSLQTKYDLFEAQSARTLEELNKLYEELQAKRNLEIKTLNEKMAAQRTEFNKERDHLKQIYADMELSLSSQINTLKSGLEAREGDISALNAANAEIQQQLEKIKLDRDDALQKLQSEKAANAELFERLKKLLNEPSPPTPAK